MASLVTSVVATRLAAALVTLAVGQDAAQDQLNALKRNLQSGMTALRHYEWIEATTIVSKGKDKGTSRARCAYDAYGMLTRVPVSTAPPASSPRGSPTKAVEKKSEELPAAVRQSITLVESYFPLDPAQVQTAKEDRRLNVRPAQFGRTEFEITSYKKPGDRISIEWDGTALQVLGVAISTYVTAMDRYGVSAQVDFQTLPDGTAYPAQKTFEVSRDSLVIKVATSKYKKI